MLVIGANADRMHSNGGGSAIVKALYEVTPLLGLHGQLGGDVRIDYLPGYEASDVVQDAAWQAESLSDGGGVEPVDAPRAARLREEAVGRARDYARQGLPVLFVGGLDHAHDLEGRDRTDMALPYGQDELIAALLEAAPDTVVVLVAGSPVAMPWADRAKALMWSWYAGCEGGTALAECLLGRVDPSGRLPESFPMQLRDCPAHAVGTFALSGHVEYAEDIYVGYRYYETRDVPVRFCFGHGLGYTRFAYSGLQVRRVADMVRVACTVTNTGARAGFAVPQVYLGLEGTGEDRPAKELKGFAKIWLEAGRSRQVTIDMPAGQALRYWSTVAGGFALAPAATVQVGESVRDIRLVGHLGRRGRRD